MNRPLLLAALALFMGMATSAFSQTKEEEKEWAKKLKELKPMDYKKLLDQKDALTSRVSECEGTENRLKNEATEKDAEIAKLKKELEDYSSGAVPGVAQKTATEGETKEERKEERAEAKAEKKETKGLVYKVQIGSFKNKDLTKYFDNNPNFSGDVDADGIKKYTLGEFTDYWEADKLKSALREMGVKGAWVVAYKDGQRVSMKDAREGIL